MTIILQLLLKNLEPFQRWKIKGVLLYVFDHLVEAEKMSHFCDKTSNETQRPHNDGIHPEDQITPSCRIPSSQPHPHHQFNIEAFLHSRACCKLLLFWSILTTLASMVSVYYAIDVHNSLAINEELREVILSRDFPVSDNFVAYDGIRRPRCKLT